MRSLKPILALANSETQLFSQYSNFFDRPSTTNQPRCVEAECTYVVADSCTQDQRRPEGGGVIKSVDGDVVIVLADGKHIGYKIGDEDVINLDIQTIRLRSWAWKSSLVQSHLRQTSKSCEPI
eukprot:m.234961 g.234961  ORF g.234961 m.234961 type:complete len:123 (-) comp33664_c1_seq4:1700-2068(-)